MKQLQWLFHMLSSVVELLLDFRFLLPSPVIYPGAARCRTVCLYYTTCVQMRSAAVDHPPSLHMQTLRREGGCASLNHENPQALVLQDVITLLA